MRRGADKGLDWRYDSSGNENNQHTDPEAPNSDSPVGAPTPHHSAGATATGSPPRDKDARHKLFRVASSTPTASGGGSGGLGGSGGSGSSKQRQTLSLSGADSAAGGGGGVKSSLLLDTCLSPTNVEPRKTLLDQLQRIFATEEAMLPDVLTIVGPPEPHSGYLTQRLAPLFAATFRPTFVPHNTAEVKAVMQALMNKIHK